MLKKSTQVRFVEARLPHGTTNVSRLRQPTSLIKYIALYQNQEGITCVLAQGESKFTLKKWKEILSATRVQPVANMCASVASAKQLEGFEEYGTYSKQRLLTTTPTGSKHGKEEHSSTRPSLAPAVEKPMLEPRKQVATEATPAPGHLIIHPVAQTVRDAVRKAYFDAKRRVEERERRMPPYIPEDYEINIDKIGTTAGPRKSAKELLERGCVLARKAALDHIDVLRRSNKLHENMIPPCLGEAARARCEMAAETTVVAAGGEGRASS
jgi:hypothetical protein